MKDLILTGWGWKEYPVAAAVALKANIPGRIAFKMFNGIDSRQIINASGAQNLAGRGDLLFTKDEADWIRAQGAWVSDETLYKEIKKSVKN